MEIKEALNKLEKLTKNEQNESFCCDERGVYNSCTFMYNFLSKKKFFRYRIDPFRILYSGVFKLNSDNIRFLFGIKEFKH